MWRSWRRTRLRTTAPPTLLPTTNPARGTAAVESASSAVGLWRIRSCGSSRWTTRHCRPARRPRRTVAVKSQRRRSREAVGNTSGPDSFRLFGFASRRSVGADAGRLRPTEPDGLCGDGRREWPGRHECACATGTHGSSRGGGYSAGTCACSLGGSRKSVPVRRTIGVRRHGRRE